MNVFPTFIMIYCSYKVSRGPQMQIKFKLKLYLQSRVPRVEQFRFETFSGLPSIARGHGESDFRHADASQNQAKPEHHQNSFRHHPHVSLLSHGKGKKADLGIVFAVLEKKVFIILKRVCSTSGKKCGKTFNFVRALAALHTSDLKGFFFQQPDSRDIEV